MKKYSRQRELILQSLKNRVDHPTAETLYSDLKTKMPEIGIATIYRNLSELCENGEIVKIKSKIGPDRFDGNLKPHIHFECDKCHEIYDIYMKEEQASKFDDEIRRLAENINAESHMTSICIYGICKNCKMLTD